MKQTLQDRILAVQYEQVMLAMLECNGSKSRAAISLGIDRKTVYKILNNGGLLNAKLARQPKSIIDLEHERMEWSLKTFPEATPLSSLLKAIDEISEIQIDQRVGDKQPMEYADAIMCILDSAGRFGVTVEEVMLAFEEKLKINKGRTWVKNPDNTYSHVK